jgi:hypothetical protein
MSRRERKRLELLSRVRRGELTLVKASELMGLSYRQSKRVYKRYVEERDAGLMHRLRGRPSNRRGVEGQQQTVLELYREKYPDFGPTLAAEYLASQDKQRVAVTTLRRWLLRAGLWEARRRRAAHRRWRARKEHLGEMVQMDGSHHDWFEGRRDWSVLMVMIDDATNRTYAQFFEEETTSAAMTMLLRYAERHGLPRSLYVDRDSIYETTRDATVDEELEIKLILAHSPQAKGRVERENGVLQDRLVKALRLAKISDLAAANTFLEETFLAELNGRFSVAPQRKADVHRRVPKDVKLEEVLSFQESRVVQNDWTVLWRKRCFQLTEANQGLALPRRRVLVCEQLDGTIRLLYQGRCLGWEELPERPARQATKRRSGPTGTGRIGHRPAADHPWRKAGSSRGSKSARPPVPPCSAPVAALPALRKAGQAGGKGKTPT